MAPSPLKLLEPTSANEGSEFPCLTQCWYIGQNSYPGHVAASDPNPSAPGMWLGADMTPSRCFAGTKATIDPTLPDLDHDWLFDSCEYVLASGFRPFLHATGTCIDAQPFWAAKYFPGVATLADPNPRGLVRIMYMPAYFVDCGYPIIGRPGGHDGDSEFIIVEASFDPSTSHWVAERLYLSNHQDDDIDVQATSGAITWGANSRSYPQIWVADGKHANYLSEPACDEGGGGIYWWDFDECWTGHLEGRLAVMPYSNVGEVFSGSMFHSLLDIYQQTSGGDCFRFGSNPRAECFVSEHRDFAGWRSDNGTSAYNSHLRVYYMAREGADGPGPDEPPVVFPSVQGPSYVNPFEHATWSAIVEGPGVPPFQYEWTLDGNVVPGQTGPSLSLSFEPSTYHQLLVRVTDSNGRSGGSTIYNVYSLSGQCPVQDPNCQGSRIIGRPGTQPVVLRPPTRGISKRPPK